jgi:tRNA nucleotidyltransferase (CCA-adding enzyme)
MKARLAEELAPHEVRELRSAGALAADMGMRLFLAGGAARDVLLERAHEDWDLVVEGDALGYARALAQARCGEALEYEEFLTATVRLPEGAIDIATARKETYASPGALPQVSPASIEEDLWRRDFTVNALAVSLCPDEWGELLDPTGGREDLRAGAIRALHDRSFWDDATRVVRGVGFEQRLGFRIDEQTEGWIREAVAGGALGTVSSERLGEALVPLLRNAVGPQVLARGAGLGVAKALGARAAFTRRAIAALGEVQDALLALGEAGHPDSRAVCCLCALMLGRGVVAEEVITRLHLDRPVSRGLRGAERFLQQWPRGFAPADRPGDLWEQLHEATFGGVAALWLASASDGSRRALEDYWLRIRGASPDFDPSVLARPGVRPGPLFGQAIRAAIRAKLNEGLGAEEQLQVARRIVEHDHNREQ